MITFRFMSTREWGIFMNIVRILTFVGIIFLIYIMLTEIEAIKLLAYDSCQICMDKTGCNCYCLNFPIE